MIRRSFENKSMIATMAVVETNKHISSSSFCPTNKRCLDGATNHYNRVNKVSTMTKMENANISNYGWKSTILFMAISISIKRCICHCWAKSHSNWTTAINNLWHEMCILQITFYLTNQKIANNALPNLRNKRKIDWSFELMPVQIINSKANNCFSEWMSERFCRAINCDLGSDFCGYLMARKNLISIRMQAQTESRVYGI